MSDELKTYSQVVMPIVSFEYATEPRVRRVGVVRGQRFKDCIIYVPRVVELIADCHFDNTAFVYA